MDDDNISDVDRVFLCPICIDRLSSPLMLSCLHSICKKCVQQYITSNDYKYQLPCPTCRQKTQIPKPGGVRGAEKLPTNHLLNSLVDAMQKQTSVGGGGKRVGSEARGSMTGDITACDPCSDEGIVVVASARCMECADNLCDLCVRRHRRNRRLQKDRLVPLADGECRGSAASEVRCSTSGSYDAIPSVLDASPTKLTEPKVCTLHPKECVQLYCTVCERLACLLCKLSACERHRCMPLEGCTDETRSRLRAARRRIEEKSTSVQALVLGATEAKTAAQARSKDARAELEHQRDQACRLVDAAFNVAVEKVDETWRRTAKSYDVYVDACETLRASLDSFGEHIDRLLVESGDGALLLESKKYVDAQLVALMAANVSEEHPTDVYVEQPTQADYEKLCGALFNVFHSHGSHSDDSGVVPTRHDKPFDEDDATPCTWRKAFAIDCNAYRMAFDRNGNMYVAFAGGLMLLKTMLEDSEVYDVAVADDGRLLVVRRFGEKWKLRCYAHAGLDLVKRWSNRVRDNFGYLATVEDRVLLAEGDHLAVYRLSDGHTLQIIRRAPDGSALVVDPLHVAVNPIYGHILVTEPASLSVKAITERSTQWVYEEASCSPSGVCVDSRGHVYVSDERNHRILHLSPSGVMQHVISIQSAADRFESPTHVSMYGREKMAVKVNLPGSRQKKVLVLKKM